MPVSWVDNYEEAPTQDGDWISSFDSDPDPIPVAAVGIPSEGDWIDSFDSDPAIEETLAGQTIPTGDVPLVPRPLAAKPIDFSLTPSEVQTQQVREARAGFRGQSLPSHLAFEAFPDAILDSTGMIADFVSAGAFSKLTGYDEEAQGESYRAGIQRRARQRAELSKIVAEKSIFGEGVASLATGVAEAAGGLVPVALAAPAIGSAGAAAGILNPATLSVTTPRIVYGLMAAQSFPTQYETARATTNGDGTPKFNAFGRALFATANTAVEVGLELLGGSVARGLKTKTLEQILNNPQVLSVGDRVVGASIDGGTELLTTVAQNTVDVVTGADPDAFDSMSEQGLLSFGIGALLSGGAHTLDALADKVSPFLADSSAENAADLGLPNDIVESPEAREQMAQDIQRADDILAERDTAVQQARAEAEKNIEEKVTPIKGVIESLVARENTRNGTEDSKESDAHADDVSAKMLDILQKQFPEAKVIARTDDAADGLHFDVTTDNSSATVRVSNNGNVSSGQPIPDVNFTQLDNPVKVAQELEALHEKFTREESGAPQVPSGPRIPPSETEASLKGVSLKNASMRRFAREFGRDETMYSPSRRQDRVVFEQAIEAGTPERALDIAQSIVDAPRVPSDLEGAGLLLKSREVAEQLILTKNRIESAEASGNTDQAVPDRHTLDRLNREFDLLREAGAAAGTEWGFGGHFRQVMLKLETNAESISARMRSAAKKRLTAKQQEDVISLAAEGDKLKRETATAQEGQNKQLGEKFVERSKREALPVEDVPEVVAQIKKLLSGNCDLE